MTIEGAIQWLEEAARYFERRPTNGEDSAHWSNVTNAENARKIAAELRKLEGVHANLMRLNEGAQ